MNINEFQKVIRGSKVFDFEGYNLEILKITNYRTGETVKIDLSGITQDILDDLLVTDEDDGEY